MVPNSTVMTVAIIFKSWFLKLATKRKIPIFCNQVEVASKIKHVVATSRYIVYTSDGIKISVNFFENNRGMRLKLSSALFRPVARINFGEVQDYLKVAFWTQKVDFLNLPPPLNPPTKTWFFGPLCNWKWTFSPHPWLRAWPL